MSQSMTSQLSAQTLTGALCVVPTPSHAPLSGAKRMVDMKRVLDNVLERLHGEFDSLLQQGPAMQDEDRKRALLLYLHSARQQLLRIVALIQWSPKAKALAEIVDHDKVLDQAAYHTRMLQAAVDDMCAAHVDRAGRFNPMFDVQTAEEVLSTGNYRDLPSAIERLKPAEPLTPAEETSKLRHVTHLIYSHLLKTSLPAHMQVVTVQDGYMLLRVEGLYEAKLTLSPVLEVPDAPSIRKQADTAAAKKQAAGGAGVAAGAAGAQAAAGTSATAMQVDGSAGVQAQGEEEEEEEDVTSGPKPQRWRWLLLSFSLIPCSAGPRPLLEPPHVAHLLQDLNFRMALAADAAVYRQREAKAKERAAATAGGAAAAAGTGAAAAAGGPAAAAGHAATPAMSSASARPGASTVTGTTTVGTRTVGGAGGGGTGPDAGGRALLASAREQLERCASDEASVPLRVVHAILVEVSMRLLVDAAVGVVQRLVGKGGRWEAHASLQPALDLNIGLRISYWLQAVPLQVSRALAAAAVAASGGADAGGRGGAGQGRAGAGAGPAPSVSPVLEVGINALGEVEVRHLPPLQPVQLLPSDDLGPAFSPTLAPGVTAPTAAAALLTTGPGHADGSGVLAAAAAGSPLPSTPTPGAPGMHYEPAATPPLTPLPIGPPPGPTLTLPPPALKLDASTLNLDEVLLRAAAHVALQELSTIRNFMVAAVPRLAPSMVCGMRIVMEPLPWRPQDTAFPSSSSGGAAGHAKGSGSAEGAGAAEASGGGGGSVVVLHVPVLEFYTDGTCIFKLSKNLFSGRLLLRPGPGLTNDAQIEAMESFHQKEEELNKAAAAAHLSAASAAAAAAAALASAPPPTAAATGPDGAPGLSGSAAAAAAAAASLAGSTNRVLKEVCGKLVRLLYDQGKLGSMMRWIAAARRLRLHLSGLSRRVLDTFIVEFPWVTIKQGLTSWSFETIMFPPHFPPLLAPAPGTPLSAQARGLSFLLLLDKSALASSSATAAAAGGAEGGAGAGGAGEKVASTRYLLLVCACNTQTTPIKVLKAIPVPSRVYTRLRDAPPHHHHHLLPSPATAAPASSAHAAAAGAAPAGVHADGLDGTQASGAAVGTAGSHASPALAGGLGTAGSAASPMPVDTPMLASGAPSPAAVPGWPGGVGTPVLSPGSHPAAAATAHYDPAHAAHATPGMPSRMLQASEAGTAVAGVGGVGGVGASRDISHELEEVVAWCRARMQWEQLLLQFQALGVQYAEVTSGSANHRRGFLPQFRARLSCLPAGLTLPQLIPRHPSPTSGGALSYVGVESVEVSLTWRCCSDAVAGAHSHQHQHPQGSGAVQGGGRTAEAVQPQLSSSGASACCEAHLGFMARVSGRLFADRDAAAAVGDLHQASSSSSRSAMMGACSRGAPTGEGFVLNSNSNSNLQAGGAPAPGVRRQRLWALDLLHPASGRQAEPPLPPHWAPHSLSGAPGTTTTSAQPAYPQQVQAPAQPAEQAQGGQGGQRQGPGQRHAPLELHYSFVAGQCAADLVQDLLALLHMQTLLAQLEAMSPAGGPACRLAVVQHGPATSSWPARTTGPSCKRVSTGAAATGAAAGAGPHGHANGDAMQVDGLTEGSMQQSAKRVKHEDGWRDGVANGHAGTNGHAGCNHLHADAADAAGGLAAEAGTTASHERQGQPASVGGAAGSSQCSDRLHWKWLGNGSVRLEAYGYSYAVLSYGSPSDGEAPGSVLAAAAGAATGGLQPSPPAQLWLHMQWRSASGAGSGGGARGTAREVTAGGGPVAPGTPPLGPGGTFGTGAHGNGAPADPDALPACCDVACCIRTLPPPPPAATAGAAAAAAEASTSPAAPPTPPPAHGPAAAIGSGPASVALCSSPPLLPRETLDSLQDMAHLQEGGLLLDTLALATWPLLQLQALAQDAPLAAQGVTFALAATQPPLQHRLVAGLAPSRAAGAAGGAPAPAPAPHLAINVSCTAIGRCWLRVSVVGARAAGAGSSGGAAAAPDAVAPHALLAAVRRSLAGVDPRLVHVGSLPHAQGGRAPSGLLGGGPGAGAAAGGSPPLWLLVHNRHLRDTLVRVASVLVASAAAAATAAHPAAPQQQQGAPPAGQQVGGPADGQPVAGSALPHPHPTSTVAQ